MPLSIYLDDSLDDDLLIALLRNAGHSIISPRDVTTLGAPDDAHLEFAAQHGCVLLTADTRDFQTLHIDWHAQGRRHSGIFFVHYEGNVAKDMKPHDIVISIDNLLAADIPIANEIHRLNHWR